MVCSTQRSLNRESGDVEPTQRQKHLVLGALAAGDPAGIAPAVAGARARVTRGIVVLATARLAHHPVVDARHRATTSGHTRQEHALRQVREARDLVDVRRAIRIATVVVERAERKRPLGRVLGVEDHGRIEAQVQRIIVHEALIDPRAVREIRREVLAAPVRVRAQAVDPCESRVRFGSGSTHYSIDMVASVSPSVKSCLKL